MDAGTHQWVYYMIIKSGQLLTIDLFIYFWTSSLYIFECRAGNKLISFNYIMSRAIILSRQINNMNRPSTGNYCQCTVLTLAMSVFRLSPRLPTHLPTYLAVHLHFCTFGKQRPGARRSSPGRSSRSPCSSRWTWPQLSANVTNEIGTPDPNQSPR